MTVSDAIFFRPAAVAGERHLVPSTSLPEAATVGKPAPVSGRHNVKRDTGVPGLLISDRMGYPARSQHQPLENDRSLNA
jgi:hypothetical protein